MKLDHPKVLESARFVAETYTKQLAAEATSNLTTVLSAYATPGKAMVEQESVVNTPLGQMETIMPVMETGATYYIVMLTAETASTPIARGLNAFPKWQLHCAAVFDSGDESQPPVIEQHLIPKERVLPDQSPAVMKALAAKATAHLSRLHGAEHRLKAITGVEQQVTTFNMIATHPEGGESQNTQKTISVDYISFLTDNGLPHMAALTSMEAGGKPEVAAVSTGIPRHIVVSWDILLKGGAFDDKGKSTQGYRSAVAAALGDTLKQYGLS